MRYLFILIDTETGEEMVKEKVDCIIGAYHNDGPGGTFGATSTTPGIIITTALAAQKAATIVLQKLQEEMKEYE